MKQILVLHDAGARLGAQADALVVRKGQAIVSRVAIGHLEEVQLHGAIELDASARRLLLRKGVDLLFFSATGTFEGRMVGRESPLGERRLAQMRGLSDETICMQLARAFVLGKIRNQRTLLRTAQRRRQDPGITAALVSMRQSLRHVETTEHPSLDALRGWEGFAAQTYFSAFGAMIVHPDFPFQGRNRRPPRDAVNALLSFGYTLLLRRVENALRSVGLDPHLGALHAAGRGKPALALDLMEEFRASVVDRLCLRLINRRQLHPGDFEDPGIDEGETGAPLDAHSREPPAPVVYLGPTGRAIFLRAFYDEMRAPVRDTEEERSMSLDAVIRRQAMQIVHLLQGNLDAYTPWTPR